MHIVRYELFVHLIKHKFKLGFVKIKHPFYIFIIMFILLNMIEEKKLKNTLILVFNCITHLMFVFLIVVKDDGR